MKPVFLLLFLLTSCATINLNGQSVEEKDLAILNSQTCNKEKVLQTIGSPTLVSQLDDNTWYYISRTLKTIPLSKPRLMSQKVVKVSFDKNGKLLEAAVQESQNDQKIMLDADSSITYGKNQTPIGHFVKNFGRFNKKREKKR